MATHLRSLLGSLDSSPFLRCGSEFSPLEGVGFLGLDEMAAVIANVTAYFVQPKSWALGWLAACHSVGGVDGELLKVQKDTVMQVC